MLVARETSLNLAHLRNMTLATGNGRDRDAAGARVLRASADAIEDVVDHTVGRILDLFGIDHEETCAPLERSCRRGIRRPRRA